MAVGPCAVSVEIPRGEGNEHAAAALAAESEPGFGTVRQAVCQPPNLLVPFSYVFRPHATLRYDRPRIADLPWVASGCWSTPRRSRSHPSIRSFAPRRAFSASHGWRIRGAMEEPSLEALREELAQLEAREAMVSAQRRHLHNQLDFGYATDDATKAREREVSAERRQLHQRIEAIRELLGEREA